jgi:hypothetical protein
MTADRPDPAEHASGPWAAPPVKGENTGQQGYGGPSGPRSDDPSRPAVNGYDPTRPPPPDPDAPRTDGGDDAAGGSDDTSGTGDAAGSGGERSAVDSDRPARAAADPGSGDERFAADGDRSPWSAPADTRRDAPSDGAGPPWPEDDRRMPAAYRDDGQPVDPGDPAYAAAQPGYRDERRPGRAALVCLAAVVVITALGAPLGLLWANLAPGVPIIKTENGGVFAKPSPEEFIAADGWFTLLGLGFGVLAALAVWYALRRYRGPLGMLTVGLGAVGAGWLAWQVGRQIGREAYRRAVETAAVGDLIHRPPDLRAGGFEWLWDVVPIVRGDVLMPAFGAIVAYTLLAGWSRYATLRKETEPPVLSWDSPEPPAQAAAPAPHAPGAAGPPHE